MRVLLLSLPGFEEVDGNLFPLGIGYLVAALKPFHEVRTYHYNAMSHARREVRDIIDSFMPDVVGLTCSTFNRGFNKEMIRLLRGIRPEIRVVVGGVHASFCYEQILLDYGADVVVIGEGEKTFPALCAALEQQSPLNDLPGIAYKRSGEVVVTPPVEIIRNLDDLPMPDYSYAKPYIERGGMAFMITSRGCPVRCTFCSTSSFWGQKVRMNSPRRVVDEMESLTAEFGVRKIFFHDDTFNLGISRVQEICNEILRRGVKVEWGCSCRVTPVSEEMIAVMVEAGCRHICWGIESGSQVMLQKINKKISLEQIRNAYELSSKFSSVMSTGAFTMVGNPGETDVTIRDTVALLNTMPITDRPSTSKLYILPGTLLYDELKLAGQIQDSDWNKYDTVPYYTLENSYFKLAVWARMVSNSGKRILFDHEKHFWNTVLDTSGQKFCNLSNSLIYTIIKTLLTPTKSLSLLRKLLPAGKIRF